MKKITLILAVMLALYGCKNETKETQTAQPQTEKAQASQTEVVTPVSPFLNPTAILPPDFYDTHGLYDGVGAVSAAGEMNYNVLMPLLKNGSYSFVEFYNLGNNVLFMQMQDPDFEPLSQTAVYTLRENIMPLGFDSTKDVKVFLYFENGVPLTQKQAKRIYMEGCAGVSEPKKCGTGILKFADK